MPNWIFPIAETDRFRPVPSAKLWRQLSGFGCFAAGLCLGQRTLGGRGKVGSDIGSNLVLSGRTRSGMGQAQVAVAPAQQAGQDR